MLIYSQNPLFLGASTINPEGINVKDYFPTNIPNLKYNITQAVESCECEFYNMKGTMYIFDKFPRGKFDHAVYHFKSKDDKYHIIIDTKVCRKSFSVVKEDMKDGNWYLANKIKEQA